MNASTVRSGLATAEEGLLLRGDQGRRPLAALVAALRLDSSAFPSGARRTSRRQPVPLPQRERTVTVQTRAAGVGDPTGSTESEFPSGGHPPPTEFAASGVLTMGGLWARVKQHKIAEWTLAYAACAFALLHGAAILGDALEWPHIILHSLALLMIVGLPVVPILAWYHGVRALTRISGAELIIIALLLAIGGTLLWLIPHPSAARAEHAHIALLATQSPVKLEKPLGVKSVAVLPFVDMSEKKDQEYFSDGLSEELIDHLMHASDLKVIARTSSFQFKGRNEDMRTIGQLLGVANLLEGSVRKSGNALRISVQLVRADTGYEVWSETYDRKLEDIFKIQDQIAEAVVNALNATLNGRSTSTATDTQNVEAHELYLQGHAIFDRTMTPAGYRTAVEYYRAALKADPSYALAWARMSEALAEQGEAGFVPMDSVRQEARRAAERALELNPRLADAHVAMARYLIEDELDLPAGEPHIRRALELEPNDQWALGWAGTVAMFRGQFREATAFFAKSIASDPVNPYRYSDLAQNYFFAREYSQALNAFHRSVDLLPNDPNRHSVLGEILLAQGDPLSALAEMDREPDDKVRLGCDCRVLAYDALGRRKEADAALAYLKKYHAEDDAYGIARVYANRGKLEEAFKWLDWAYRLRDPDILTAHVDPLLKNVQSDGRFAALMKKLRLLD